MTIEILSILGTAIVVAFTAYYFNKRGWNACFQEQIAKLEQRQALGEMTIQKADIVKVCIRHIMPGIPNKLYEERKEWVIRNMAQDIGEQLLKDGLLDLKIGSYPTQDSMMYGDPQDRTLQLDVKILKF